MKGKSKTVNHLSDLHKTWERKNLEPYVIDDKRKWKYADQDKNDRLSPIEYEYFRHPREHEAMITYIAMVRYL